jgi:hypothetical protein
MELNLQSLKFTRAPSTHAAVLISCDQATSLPPPPAHWAHIRGRYWSAK